MLHKVQKKLYKAYGKVGKILGEQHDLFRASDVNDPLVLSNFIDTTYVSFSLDDKYSKTPTSGLNIWNCYVNGNLENLFDIQQGDLIYSQETGKTWMVSSAEVMLPIRAIALGHTISVQRHGYGDTGSGFAPGDMEVATLIPCHIETSSPGGGSLGYIRGGNYQTENIPTAVIYLWDPLNTILVGDAVIDSNGQRYQVRQNDRTEIGNQLIVQAYEAA